MCVRFKMSAKFHIATVLLCLCVNTRNVLSAATGGKRRCVVITECKELDELARTHSNAWYKKLSSSQCGFQGYVPMVWCSELTNEPSTEKECTAPTGEKGLCMEPKKCRGFAEQEILKSFTAEEKLEAMEYYRCNEHDTNICCPSPHAEVSLPPEPIASTNNHMKKCDLTATPPTIESGCCGLEDSGDVRITNGKATSIDQYPWLVVIDYDRIEAACGGFLISGRYVLTAAHCVIKQKLQRIRLGEYNTTNTGPDSIVVAGGGTECTDGAIFADIESVEVHEDYKPDVVYRPNDIALIRLTQNVNYTAFIRPICLPTSDRTLSLSNDTHLLIAGWGAVDAQKRRSPIKLHTTVPYVYKQDCNLRYRSPRSDNLLPSQICAGGEDGKDICDGDSGGPLMFEHGLYYEALGINSFGTKACATEKFPSIYTKVYDYLDWIQQKIKP